MRGGGGAGGGEGSAPPREGAAGAAPRYAPAGRRARRARRRRRRRQRPEARSQPAAAQPAPGLASRRGPEEMEQEKYLPELMAEKDSLDPSFVHAMRLLADGKAPLPPDAAQRRLSRSLPIPSHPRGVPAEPPRWERRPAVPLVGLGRQGLRGSRLRFGAPLSRGAHRGLFPGFEERGCGAAGAIEPLIGHCDGRWWHVAHQLRGTVLPRT